MNKFDEVVKELESKILVEESIEDKVDRLEAKVSKLESQVNMLIHTEITRAESRLASAEYAAKQKEELRKRGYFYY